MDLAFAAPAPGLAQHVSAYYLYRDDLPLIEDRERADVGYLRLMVCRGGAIRYAKGAVPASDIMLLGPSTETAAYTTAGPLISFGCVLLPPFWGGIVPISAESVANFAVDGANLLGPHAKACFEDIMAMDDVEAMARRMDALLLPRVTPIPDDHERIIALIGEWLAQYPIPHISFLQQRAPLSERQLTRVSNRYFGAPPRMLARKFRALRTASKIIGTRGRLPHSLIDEYSDQAHMAREIKHFTGMTPRGLQITSNPIMQLTLHPDNFRHDAPWT